MTNTAAIPSNGAPFRSPQAALRRTRLRYGAGVALRLAWYAGLARLVGRLTPPPARPVPSVGRLPGPAQLRADVLALMKADLANIEAGYYPVPADLLPRPRRTLRAARDLLRDLPAVAQRRRAADIGAVPEIEGMPDYFRRTFHYQTDGYLSDRSAMLYDTQVEVLFLGTAAMMRRQALAPIARYLADRPEIALPRLLDIACGTGLFLAELGKAFPAIRRSGPGPQRALSEGRRNAARRPSAAVPGQCRGPCLSPMNPRTSSAQSISSTNCLTPRVGTSPPR